MTDKQPFSSPRHSSLGPRSFYRGRFAPSPTGPLHFGSLIAALGSYLQARHQHGQWWLRIEDIDPPREVEGASEAIIALLAEYGYEWDTLSYQSQRQHLYEEALVQLQHQHLTYPCTCTRRGLAEQLGHPRGPLIYPGNCRERHFPLTQRHAIRVRTDTARIHFEDQLQGAQRFDLPDEIGDFILRRSDGLFSYQLAVALDDADQGMTEVIRGTDLLDSTPRQIYLQQLLGFTPPVYGHLPVAVNQYGRKLSKQTFAEPLHAEDPVSALSRAMAFLGHEVPEEIQRGSLQSFWDWAIANWSLARVPARLTIPVD